MIAPTVRASRAGPMWRRRSPSVTMPQRAPVSSTTPRQPKRFSVMTRKRTVHAGVRGHEGHSVTGVHQFPRPAQPRAQASAGMDLTEIRGGEATAGEQRHGQGVAERHLHGGAGGGREAHRAGFVGTGSSSTASAARAKALSARAVMATSLMPNRRLWATRSASSGVSPELDTTSMASPGTIMPRSPWEASAGWTNRAGVPVEARVAAILRATWPDLPMPETTMRPRQRRGF